MTPFEERITMLINAEISNRISCLDLGNTGVLSHIIKTLQSQFNITLQIVERSTEC